MPGLADGPVKLDGTGDLDCYTRRFGWIEHLRNPSEPLGTIGGVSHSGSSTDGGIFVVNSFTTEWLAWIEPIWTVLSEMKDDILYTHRCNSALIETAKLDANWRKNKMKEAHFLWRQDTMGSSIIFEAEIRDILNEANSSIMVTMRTVMRHPSWTKIMIKPRARRYRDTVSNRSGSLQNMWRRNPMNRWHVRDWPGGRGFPRELGQTDKYRERRKYDECASQREHHLLQSN